MARQTSGPAQAAPKRALLIAVKAVTGSEAYWREPAGAHAVLQFVRRFAIRLGWHRAIELVEELDELFR